MGKRTSHLLSSPLLSSFHLSMELLIFFRLFFDVWRITWHNSIRSILFSFSPSVNTFFVFNQIDLRREDEWSSDLTSVSEAFRPWNDANSRRTVRRVLTNWICSSIDEVSPAKSFRSRSIRREVSTNWTHLTCNHCPRRFHLWNERMTTRRKVRRRKTENKYFFFTIDLTLIGPNLNKSSSQYWKVGRKAFQSSMFAFVQEDDDVMSKHHQVNLR